MRDLNIGIERCDEGVIATLLDEPSLFAVGRDRAEALQALEKLVREAEGKRGHEIVARFLEIIGPLGSVGIALENAHAIEGIVGLSETVGRRVMELQTEVDGLKAHEYEDHSKLLALERDVLRLRHDENDLDDGHCS